MKEMTKQTDFKDSRRKSLAMAMVLPKNAQPWAVAAWAVPGITDMKEGTTMDLGEAGCPRVVEWSMQPIILKWGIADAQFIGDFIDGLLAIWERARDSSGTIETGAGISYKQRADDAHSIKGILGNIGWSQGAATAAAVEMLTTSLALLQAGNAPLTPINHAAQRMADRHTVEELSAAYLIYSACLDRRMALLRDWYTAEVRPLLESFPYEEELESDSDSE